MSDQIQIVGKKIGEGCPVFIIAEIGVNHNGSVELAKEMIREAARCGADCVKFQTFKADRVASDSAPKASYQLKTTDPQESQIAMLEQLELGFNEYRDLVKCCQEEGVVFMSTPYNVEDLEFLEELGVPAYKLASMHAVEPWFAALTAMAKKPVILSTGMANMMELDETVRAMRETGNKDLILLQCTTNYPSRMEDTNLLAMQTIARAFDVIVGYSDHTAGDLACILSIGLGAKVIEKHFTTDKNLMGPDQSTSADKKEFAALVRQVRQAEVVMGSNIKEPCAVELENSIGMRRSIWTRVDIVKGQTITSDMITYKRPATGISPRLTQSVLGKRCLCDVASNIELLWDHLAD
ncbi:N-acetylneuraminate synthase family protein [Litorivicinus sp.]|nr:N-acetylneuraminate synthase family protein [Litorivicinus sp.]MDC1239989.1 N-acetylneuraminate synthase family protein [Litorivicinus sp.]